MNMLRSCCCVKTCNRKWTPRDDVDRELRFTGVSVTLDSHPYESADDLHLPLDVLPSEPRELAGGGDFAHGSGDGIGYFGLSSEVHRIDWQVKKETEDHFHSIDRSFIGPTHDISTPDNADGVPMDWAEAQQGNPGIMVPNCYRQAVWGGPSANSETTYGLPYGEPVGPATITYDKMLFRAPADVKGDSMLYLKAKAIGGYYVGDDNWPKTYAEMDGGHVLFDVVVSVLYNYNLGPTATSIKNVSKYDYYDWDPDTIAFWAPAIYQGKAGDVAGVPITRQPGGDGGSGYGGPEQIRPYFGTHTIRRKVTEYIGVSGRGRFRNGEVALDVGFGANIKSTAERAYAPYTFGEPNPVFQSMDVSDDRVWPDAAEDDLSIGYPGFLTTYVNAGFSTMQIAFDAEWNAGILDQFANFSPTKSVYAAFTWRSDLDPDNLPANVTGTLNGPITGNAHPHHSMGIDGRGYLKPFHECELTYEFDLETTNDGEYYNVFDKRYGPENELFLTPLFSADETKNSSWRKPPVFSGPLALQTPPSGGTITNNEFAYRGAFSVDESGHVVSDNSVIPSFEATGVDSSAMFTREESE